MKIQSAFLLNLNIFFFLNQVSSFGSLTKSAVSSSVTVTVFNSGLQKETIIVSGLESFFGNIFIYRMKECHVSLSTPTILP